MVYRVRSDSYRMATRLPAVAAVLVLAAGCGAAGARTGRPPGANAGANAAATATAAAATASTAGPSSGSASPSPAIDVHAAAATIMTRIARSDVPVLVYHQIRDWRPSDSEQARPYIMPPATFRWQMRYLASHGFRPISPDRLLANLTTGAPLPPKPILLTFDDADGAQFDTAFPVLRKHHFTATFFIMTVVLGKRHYMSAKQLRELSAAGMTIGSHTWDHHRVDRYSGSDWKIQIARPSKKLTAIVGHPIRYFAYPYGVWNAAAFEHLRKNGIWAAFQLAEDPVSKAAPLYTLPRTIANPFWSHAEFVHHIGG